MEAITQGDTVPPEPAKDIHHLPVRSESQRTPKKNLTNIKQGIRGRKASHQSPQRTTGYSKGGPHGRNLGWYNQSHPKQGNNYDLSYGQHYGQIQHQSGRESQRKMRNPERMYHDQDTYSNLRPHYESRGYVDRDRVDYESDNELESRNCFFPLRDREGPGNPGCYDYKQANRVYESYRSVPSRDFPPGQYEKNH